MGLAVDGEVSRVHAPTGALRVVFLLFGVALLVFLFARTGPGTVVDTVGRLGLAVFPIAAVYGAYQTVRAMALAATVRKPRAMSLRDALLIRLSGEALQFLTFTGPFVAEPTKAWLLKNKGLGTAEGFAATLTEYLAYMFTSAALSIAALGWLLTHGTLGGGLRATATVLVSGMVAFLVAAAWAIVRRYYLLGAILE